MKRKFFSKTLSALLLGVSFTNLATAEEVKHPTQVIHPGISTSNEVSCVVSEIRRSGMEPNEFFMDVDSVSCGDKFCEIVKVRIFWDELGFYTHYKLAPGVKLEKAEGELFTKRDYSDLQRILLDTKSALRTAEIVDVVEYRKADESVDGVTAATLKLHHKEYVKGAFWTSYTLWHWAHSRFFNFMRGITAEQLDNDQLCKHLVDGSVRYKIFAMDFLTKRTAYDDSVLTSIIQASASDNYNLRKRIMAYVEGADAGNYFSVIDRLSATENPELRLMLLASLKNTAHAFPLGYLKQLGERLTSSGSYQEISSYIEMVEALELVEPDVLSVLSGLLSHENFLVARRVYWFLGGQTLSAAQKELMTSFEGTHGARL